MTLLLDLSGSLQWEAQGKIWEDKTASRPLFLVKISCPMHAGSCKIGGTLSLQWVAVWGGGCLAFLVWLAAQAWTRGWWELMRTQFGMPEKPAGEGKLRKICLHLLVHLLHERSRLKRRPKVIAELMLTGSAGTAVFGEKNKCYWTLKTSLTGSKERKRDLGTSTQSCSGTNQEAVKMSRVWEKEPFKRFQSTGKKIAEQQIFPCSYMLIMSFPNTHLSLHLRVPEPWQKATGPDQQRPSSDWQGNRLQCDDPWSSYYSRVETKITVLPGKMLSGSHCMCVREVTGKLHGLQGM